MLFRLFLAPPSSEKLDWSPTSVTNGNPVMTRLFRGEYFESAHRGSLVLVGPEGQLESHGETEENVLPRSSLKPLQLMPLFASGEPARLGLSAEQQAILVASHSGDELHVDAVRTILLKAGISESALACGTSEPMDIQATARLYQRGGAPTRVHHNCSGKHSGFLIRSRMLGAPLEGYLDPSHPVQCEIRETLNELTGASLGIADAVIDGCGAPMYPLPMDSMARLILDLANPERLPARYQEAARAIFAAINAAPHYLAGRARIDSALLLAAPGRFLVKCGAEGYFLLGQRAGEGQEAWGLALKTDDGSTRGYESFLARYLVHKGMLDGSEKSMKAFFAGRIENSQGLTIGEYRTEHESLGRI
jgi:L-asparaginase II